MKKIKISLIVIAVLAGIILVVFPHIEILTDYKFIACRYSDDMSQFETESSINGDYIYYEKKDLSISSYEVKKFLFFHVIIMDYEEGNYMDSEFMLGESYINAFIEFGIIYENPDNVDVEKLIEGRTPIEGNKWYEQEGKASRIYYNIEGDEATMYVFEVDDLVVFRVEFPNESPKFIAYK